MSIIPMAIAIIAIGYLIGSIPTAYLMMHLFRKQDIRKFGTGNVTATAVMIHGGRLPGTLSIVGEALKTFLCLFIAYLLVGELWAYLLMFIAASVGEIWSIWLKWAGGRGQAIFVTGFLVLCPLPFLLGVVFFPLALIITRSVSLSNHIFHLAVPPMLMTANLFNPAMFGLGQHSWGYAVTGALLCAIFFAKHRRATDDIIEAQAWGTYSR